MGIYLNPDNMDFQIAINSELYVDKSELIKRTNALIYTEQRFICVSRPRRFGKSLFLSMVDNFFNIEYKDTNKDLFKGLKISKSKYYNRLSSNPVIKLDFKFLKQDNFEIIYILR